MEDKDIIELYWNREETAVSATAEKYGNYCYSVAYNILYNKEDAEESVNDTYLGAWNSIPPHKPEVLSSFLAKITRNVSLKRRRDKLVQKRGGGDVSLAYEELGNYKIYAEFVNSNLLIEGDWEITFPMEQVK